MLRRIFESIFAGNATLFYFNYGLSHIVMFHKYLLSFQFLLSTPPFMKYLALYDVRRSFPDLRSIEERLESLVSFPTSLLKSACRLPFKGCSGVVLSSSISISQYKILANPKTYLISLLILYPRRLSAVLSIAPLPTASSFRNI